MLFRLWSHKHGMWWRALGEGYTSDIDNAGLFTQEVAIGYVLSSSYCGIPQQTTSMVAAPTPPPAP